MRQKGKGKTMVKIDMWYKGEHPTRYTANFYPNDGEYRGNLFNADDKPIGDFVADDSVEMERRLDEICNRNLIVEIPTYIVYELGAVEAVKRGMYIAWTLDKIEGLKDFGYKSGLSGLLEFVLEHASHGLFFVVVDAKEGRVSELKEFRAR